MDCFSCRNPRGIARDNSRGTVVTVLCVACAPGVTCGCGRAVPQEAAQTAARTGHALICGACGARGTAAAIVAGADAAALAYWAALA